MAFRPDYLIRETGQNLFRNPSLSIASVLTVAVSLSLMGAALLIQQGVSEVNKYFREGVEFNIWMNLDVQDDQVQAVSAYLSDSPYIRDWTYVNEEDTYQEFQSFYADAPDILDLVSANQIPTSFRVTPIDVEVESIEVIGSEIERYAGVKDVNFASDDIKTVSAFSRGSSRVMLFAAAASAVAAALLMYNSIRTAVFARRREIEVMRLVGATKWFIRIPFMLEGLLQGLFGAFLSIFAVFALNRGFANFFKSQNIYAFRNFALQTGDLMGIAVALILVGALLGAAGAGLAVTRYLDA